MNLHFKTVSPGSSLLADVQELWRQNSDTLGFFPNGAFEQYAQRDWIIAAVTGHDELIGYLAFSCSKRRAVIVHLCVSRKFIGQGVPRALFEELLSKTKDQTAGLLGVLATCRADFRASRLWPLLGFQLKGSRPARKTDKILEIWWYDFGSPNLFSLQAPQLAVLDSNVFFDILDPEQMHHEESKLLLSDWLADSYQLTITPELMEEISRSADKARKTRGFAEARQFEQTKARAQDVERYYTELCISLGSPQNQSEVSDSRQLAHAIAGRASHFVTRDGRLLRNRKAIEGNFGTIVLRPAELVAKFDMDERPQAYEPTRLDGSNIDIRLMKPDELEGLTTIFLDYAQGEHKSMLRSELVSAMSNVARSRVEVVTDAHGAPLALTVAANSDDLVRDIRVLRVAPGALSTTLAWHLVWRHVVQAVDDEASGVRFTDRYAPRNIDATMLDVGFVRSGTAWHKVVLGSVLSRSEVKAKIAGMVQLGICPAEVSDASAALSDEPLEIRQVAASHRLEKLIWPARVKNSGIPCYVVPIRPRWAQALFDSKAGANKLFAPEANLLLRFENAYYRSGRQLVPTPMSRILWYVSGSKHEPRSKSICAVSLVNEVVRDKPQVLFRAYKHYGVYRLRDLLEIQPKPSGSMIAFTFSHTALLPKPIRHSDVVAFLASREVTTNNFVSPVHLRENDWMDLYLLGL